MINRKVNIFSAGIHGVIQGLKFLADPGGIGFVFHGAGTEIGEKDSFRLGAYYSSRRVICISS